MSFRVQTVKTWRKSHFSYTSAQCCFVTDTFTFSHPLLSLLIFCGFVEDKSGVILFGLDSVSFALLLCGEHQTCLVQQWDCLEIEILCSRKQLLNIYVNTFMCSVQIFTVKYLKTWWALCTSLWFFLLFHSCWIQAHLLPIKVFFFF